jgi:hypothetical protein
MKSFPRKAFYGGQIITPETPGTPSTAPGKIEGFVDLMENRDPFAAIIMSF